MAHSVHITARALREIDETLEWLPERSRLAASRWHGQLLEAISSLEDNSERYRLAHESEWYHGDIRQLLHDKRRGIYRNLFEVRGATVYILRVCHSAPALLEPGEL